MKYSREYWTVLKEVVSSKDLNIRDKIITLHNVIRTISCQRCLNHYLTQFKSSLTDAKNDAELIRWFERFYYAANQNQDKFGLFLT